MTNEISGPSVDENSADELRRLLLVLSDALTDSMVERLATTAGVALEVVDRLNEEDTRSAIHSIIDRMTELHRIGALDTLFETVLLVHAVRSAATDSIVDRLFGIFEQAANTFGSEAMLECADDVLSSLDKAANQGAAEPAKGGIMATIAMLSKPETQQTLQFLLKFGAELHKSRQP
jgi:uncharacterized protein YjgD (DUF1641 family)